MQKEKKVLLLLLGLLLAGCSSHAPIKIGYAAEITGRRGEIGVAGRDGASLAVDWINAQGRIQGHPLELVAMDDKGDPETARRVDQELIQQKVAAIIGHITSEQTAAVFDQINQAGVVLLSPTSSSSQFSQQKDFFFRVVPDTTALGKAIAYHVFTNRGIRQLTGVIDLNNQSFSQPLWQAIQDEFVRLGGETVQLYTFTTGQTDLKQLMNEVAASQPQTILFVASGIDTALMVQYVRQLTGDIPLFSSTWALTDELIDKGGKAVEGLELGAIYNPDLQTSEYQDFLDRFEKRYRRQPGLAASHSYEAVMVLAHALEQTGGDTASLPQALAQIKNFRGLQGNISFDEYGDVQRDIYIAKVVGGEFVIIATVPPNLP
jgi:branched-chain amino acid transport system substrate-binding protein